ncbi:MAG: hypothetical protein ACOY3K_06190 [Candidatus Omnitrophota bacterium]
MDPLDRYLWTRLNRDLPLVPEPFEALARECGANAAEVLLKSHRLRQDRLLGPIRAKLDLRTMGYREALFIASLKPQTGEDGIRALISHPAFKEGWVRNEGRDFWFRAAFPSSEVFAESIRVWRSGPFFLEVTRIRFPASSTGEGIPGSSDPESAQEWSALQIGCLRALQEEVPITDRPFRAMGEKEGIAEEVLIRAAADLKQKGILRGIRAVPEEERDTPAAIMLWNVPKEVREDRILRVGALPGMGSCVPCDAEGSFPYTVYAETELKEIDPAKALWERAKEAIGPWPGVFWMNEKHYRKKSFRYYDPSFEAWLAANRRDSFGTPPYLRANRIAAEKPLGFRRT